MRHALPEDVREEPLEAVRRACARVAERARLVRIDQERLESYAAQIPVEEVRAAAAIEFPRGVESTDARIAYVLTLDAVNFGSGYFPLLAKRPGLSGYRTIEASLGERFEIAGPFSAAELEAMKPSDCARLFGQSCEIPEIEELMSLFALAWRDLGRLVRERFGGSFAALVEAARGSAEELVRSLLQMPLYRDIAPYQELMVPFLKRAQISAADLAPLRPFRDLERLTMFADNLVAHVLRTDGVLRYAEALLARIEREELIPWGCEEEVEIRACEVHAVELLVERLEHRVAPHQLDAWLWMRGGRAAYRARPRHRTRCAFY